MSNYFDHLLWSPYVIGQTITYSSCFFLSSFLSFFFLLFSSPNLSGWRLDVYHTLTHGVANTGPKKSPSRHHRTTLSSHIFANKAYIDNRKKLVKQQCPDNMVNFGPLTAEIGSGVWGTPTNFNGFCVLAALLHGI